MDSLHSANELVGSEQQVTALLRGSAALFVPRLRQSLQYVAACVYVNTSMFSSVVQYHRRSDVIAPICSCRDDRMQRALQPISKSPCPSLFQAFWDGKQPICARESRSPTTYLNPSSIVISSLAPLEAFSCPSIRACS
jgi:hypothetical protein